MLKKNNKKNGKKNGKDKLEKSEKPEKKVIFALPDQIKKWIWGIVVFILALIIALSFLNKSGVAGEAMRTSLAFLIGEKGSYIFPIILVLGALVFFKTKYDKFWGPSLLGMLILTLGIAGSLEVFNTGVAASHCWYREGGCVGYFLSWPFLKLFGTLVPKIIFSGVTLVGLIIFWFLLRGGSEPVEEIGKEEKPSLVKKIFAPKFEVKEVEPQIKERPVKQEKEPILTFKAEKIPTNKPVSEIDYKLPSVDLLETEKGKPAAGDTATNSAIIKKTLENFGLGVEMSEVNIGPTVTQYTLKPAEGIKLSKITGLSNNLSLALASHPIRIEAPIPGKSLVGIEIPNKERCRVRLKDVISTSEFQGAGSSLTLALGKDVSGHFVYADLARMPHLLVAGATGAGKTIFLNNLILTLLYQNSPETLRMILIDPKRVEFSAYKDLPHLLAPIIFDAQKAVNALRWLVSEMERRFQVLSGNGSRDITSYNKKVRKTGEDTPLPFIVLIVDELADLMAARGRDIEAGIVRLAQMARAVGIHLVLATQRPSVEVITGTIKANITARVTFQVASQVDSRTIIDTAGAEKLLGMGDMLFISAELGKPKRVQSAYISEKEINKVADFVREEGEKFREANAGDGELEASLSQELEKEGEVSMNNGGISQSSDEGDDPLYGEAKRVVIESKKASASLLQRRLKVGYARAARLLDILEENGVVGPQEGAKPREVLVGQEEDEFATAVPPVVPEAPSSEDDEWEKV